MPMTPRGGHDIRQQRGGTPNSAQSSRPTRRSPMSSSSVREAFVTSVTCTRPPVSFQSSQESTVPQASSPASARARAPFTLSRIHAILVAEKYGSIERPVRSRTSAP